MYLDLSSSLGSMHWFSVEPRCWPISTKFSQSLGGGGYLFCLGPSLGPPSSPKPIQKQHVKKSASKSLSARAVRPRERFRYIRFSSCREPERYNLYLSFPLDGFIFFTKPNARLFSVFFHVTSVLFCSCSFDSLLPLLSRDGGVGNLHSSV